MSATLLQSTAVGLEPLAIIGLACRLPGGANDPATFWEQLKNGHDAITEVPPERWSLSAHFSADRSRPGKSYARHGGFLDQVDAFDAAFFGISPREAMRMDPQQRLALELAWEAFEDAGLDVTQLAGSRSSVYVAVTLAEYNTLQVHPDAYPLIDSHTGTGLNFSIIANRISYQFDLRGPSVAVDTACSGALVAVHHACQTLWHEGCEFALAGGVNLNLKPDTFVMHSKASMLSPTGRCRAFDAQGDGFVRSEGGGLLVLRPLSAAIRNGDTIRAVIRSTSVNQDGRTVSITMPNRDAQVASIQAALHQAQVHPHQIQYVEAHGPGTPVGDPIEADAIGTALSEARIEDCVIGSVKTNVGHLEAASGAAGLIKLVLALQHRQIPPTLHFKTPNPRIALGALKLRVATSLEPWPANCDGAPRLGGINSFGFGGTNAHAIVAEPPDSVGARQNQDTRHSESRRAELLVVSARSEAALMDLGRAYCARLALANTPLADLCYSSLARRSHHAHRMAVVGHTAQALSEQLQSLISGQPQVGASLGRTDRACDVLAPVFVFSGMGQQWPLMGRRLYEQEPVFARELQACQQALGHRVDWSLTDVMQNGVQPIDRTDVAQVAIFALQVSLAALWRSWGIEPSAVVGHSVGEVAAAHVAGVLSLTDAIEVIVCRSRLQATVAGLGSMMAVDLTWDDARQWLRAYEGQLSIAAVNAAGSLTLAGNTQALRELADQLTQRQVFNRFLKVEVPYHSPLMDPLMEPLATSLNRLRPQPGTIPLVSTVTGSVIAGPEVDGHYWAKNIRQPVLFAQAMAALVERGHQLFLEISAHPVLSNAMRGCAGSQAQVFASLRRERDERACLLSTLGELYCMGWPLDSASLYPNGGRYVGLPSYPWQRIVHWQEAEATRIHRLGAGGHPLLGQRLAQPNPAWESEIDLARLTYLAGHQIQGEIVFPYTAYCEMALAAARELSGSGVFVLAAIELDRALVLRQDRPVKLRLEFNPETTAFVIHSLSGREWLRHVSGKVAHQTHCARPAPLDLEVLRNRCRHRLTGVECYRELTEIGYDYGKSFQGVQELWYGEAGALDDLPAEAVYRLSWPSELPTEVAAYVTHPAVIDAYFNGVLAVLIRRARRTWIPIHTEESIIYEHPGQTAWAYMRLVAIRGDHLELDLTIADEQGQICVTIRGMQYRALGSDAHRAQLANVTFQEQWLTQALVQTQAPSARGRRCLVLTECQTTGESLQSLIEARKGSPTLVVGDAEHCAAVLQSNGAFDELVYVQHALPEPDACAGEIIDCTRRVLALVQVLARVRKQPRLWLVTRGVHAFATDSAQPPMQAPLWGMGRVITNELPTLRVRLVDLHSGNQDELHALAAEILSTSEETEIALNQGQRYVHRVQTLDLMQSGRRLPFRLALRTPGTLEALYFEALPPLQPATGQVLIEVQATGLNFKDLVKTLNLIDEASLARTYAGRTLGFECAGRVLAVGPGVTGLAVGDEVMALAQHCFATRTVTEAAMVVHKPATLSFAQAAACPVVYMTAYAALRSFGRLERGERILIHTAAGGVGQAALQLALCAGAEVYATAGSEEKRAWLRSQGVTYVGDSRSLAFVSEILKATQGQGVDLVLNTLPARTLPGSLSLLRPRGRLVDLSNFYSEAQVDLKPFQKGLSLIAFDLDQLMRSDPPFISRLFHEAMDFVFDQALPAPPIQCFPIARIHDAFRHLAQGQNLGKVVVTLEATEEVTVDATTAPLPSLRADCTYLVTGATSGFGLTTAQWLAERGAGHLVLLSRRGLTTPEAMLVVAELRRANVGVTILQCDVGNFNELRRAFEQIETQLPPLRGIIHAATIYADGVIEQMTPDQMQRVLGPKAMGAWYLHQLSQALPLDFFVLYSSIATTIGNPGQANYVAANALLDHLAAYRRAIGLPGLAVAFGAIAQVGYLAREQAIGARLEHSGITMLSPAQALLRLGALMQLDCTQGIVSPMQWQTASGRLAALRCPRFESLVRQLNESEAGELSLSDELANCEPGARVNLLAARLALSAARILAIAADQLDIDTPLTRLGLDSLMAVELSQQLRQRFGIELSSMRLLSGDSLARIAQDQLTQLMAEPHVTHDEVPAASSTAMTSVALLPPVSIGRNDQQVAPLSFQQIPMWRLEQRYPGRSFYNLPTLVHFQGPLDTTQLRRALHELTVRHETLRLRIADVDGGAGMRFDASTAPPLAVDDLQRLPEPAREQRVAEQWRAEQLTPFDLTQQSPLRVRVLLLTPNRSALIVVLHHLAVDGASFPIIFTELYELYQAAVQGRSPVLPNLSVRYSDFARWQHETFTGPALDPWLEKWRELLGAGVRALPLPYDHQRPQESTYHGARQRFSVSLECANDLRALAQQEQSTLFMMLVAALGVLVQRLTGVDEFCLGTFVANRTQPELRNLVGCFINCIALRVDLTGDPSFRLALARVRANALAAQQLADLPFELLREHRVVDQAPQVVLILHSELAASTEHRVQVSDNLQATHQEGENQGAKRDWTFHLFDTPLGLTGYLEYDTDVFAAATAATVVESYCRLLDGIVAEPGAPVSTLMAAHAPMLEPSKASTLRSESRSIES